MSGDDLRAPWRVEFELLNRWELLESGLPQPMRELFAKRCAEWAHLRLRLVDSSGRAVAVKAFGNNAAQLPLKLGDKAHGSK